MSDDSMSDDEEYLEYLEFRELKKRWRRDIGLNNDDVSFYNKCHWFHYWYTSSRVIWRHPWGLAKVSYCHINRWFLAYEDPFWYYHIKQLSYYPLIFSIRRSFLVHKNCHIKWLSYYPVSYYPGGSVVHFNRFKHSSTDWIIWIGCTLRTLYNIRGISNTKSKTWHFQSTGPWRNTTCPRNEGTLGSYQSHDQVQRSGVPQVIYWGILNFWNWLLSYSLTITGTFDSTRTTCFVWWMWWRRTFPSKLRGGNPLPPSNRDLSP